MRWTLLALIAAEAAVLAGVWMLDDVAIRAMFLVIAASSAAAWVFLTARRRR